MGRRLHAIEQQRMLRRQQATGIGGQGDGGLQPFGQRLQHRAGTSGAATCEDQWLARGGQQLHRRVDIHRGRGRGLRQGARAQVEAISWHLQHVEGDFDVHRPRPRTTEQRKGAGQHFGQFLWALQGMAEGADPGDDGTLVGHFMQVAVAQALVLAAAGGGDHQHRHRVGVGLAHGGEDIGHAGAGNDEAHSRLAAGAGITVGHEPGTLLVPWADVAQRTAVQSAIQLDRVHAGNAEHRLHAVAFE